MSTKQTSKQPEVKNGSVTQTKQNAPDDLDRAIKSTERLSRMSNLNPRNR